MRGERRVEEERKTTTRGVRERGSDREGKEWTTTRNNDPVLTEIEWISQSILSANEIRGMGRDGVVPFVELAGGAFSPSAVLLRLLLLRAPRWRL